MSTMGLVWNENWTYQLIGAISESKNAYFHSWSSYRNSGTHCYFISLTSGFRQFRRRETCPLLYATNIASLDIFHLKAYFWESAMVLHILAFNSFFIAEYYFNEYWMDEYITIWLFIHWLMDIWTIFNLATVNNAVMNFHIQMSEINT